MADDQALLEAYSKLFPEKKPETEEEKALSQELSAQRKAFLTTEAEKRGYENVGTLQKELDKALKKLQKKKEPKKEKKEAKKAKKEEGDASAAVGEATKEEEEVDEHSLDDQMRRILGSPEENVGLGDYFVNSEEVLKKHLEATGGKWQLRFPPEPNGWLHIGHAKAMSVNFGIAKANGGNCYMRFDDTNPDKEKQEFIDGILDNLAWLGHTPFKVTYTSDYFDDLYNLACELTRRGKAYVCLLKKEEVSAQRDALKEYHNRRGRGEDVEFPSEAVYDPSRERSPEENLVLLEKMKDGRFEENEATLRMKGDFHSANPNMWDHMAYRIQFKSHPRTGDKWCIYPTYDYSHCLVDSLENITHSLCTLEFQTRQAPDSSYHWLLDALDMYHPKTWEYSRCSISCNVMSKRRLQHLVNFNHVSGWDDPRLLTLAGLRRRGYTPTAINTFCRRIGIARSSNEVCISMSVLESCIRNELDHEAPRRLAVLDPVKVVITNFAQAAAPSHVTVPNHPAKGREDMGTREVPFTEVLYIPREKFRLDVVKGYKGLCPADPKTTAARLLNAKTIVYESHECDADGNVTEVRVRIDDDVPTKGLSVITWVPSSALRATVRIYDRLFKDCDINGVEYHAERAAKEKGFGGENGFLELLNEDSLREGEILVEPGISAELTVDQRWQFVTLGYFCIDRVDSTPEKPIFNMVVSLKEDKSKAAAVAN